MNEVTLIGNITGEIETKQVSEKFSVTSFSLATNESYKSGNEWKKHVEYHNINVYNRLGQKIQQEASKGSKIFLRGKIRKEEYTDRQGNKKYYYKIVADLVEVMTKSNSQTTSDNLPY